MNRNINTPYEKAQKVKYFLWSQKMIFLAFIIPYSYYLIIVFLGVNSIIDFFNKIRYVDIFFIFLSAYMGWVVLELIKILRTPQLKTTLSRKDLPWSDVDGQIILEISVEEDQFNKLFGTIDLSGLRINRALINKRKFPLRWGNSPEPINYSFMELDPGRIPNSNITTIDSEIGDYIIIAWTKNNEIFIADPWFYTDRVNPKNKIVLPLDINLKMRSEGYNYIYQAVLKNINDF